jgi:hypothetical protein
LKISGDLLQRPLSPEMVIFYITQDTQRHPLLPELKSGLLIYLQRYTYSLNLIIKHRKEICAIVSCLKISQFVTIILYDNINFVIIIIGEFNSSALEQ